MDLRRGPLDAHSPGGFRTVWLNIYGWGALVGVGLAIGAATALLTPLPLPVALGLGVLSTWALLFVLDRRRYLNSSVHLSDSRLEAETYEAIVHRLVASGTAALYQESTYEEGEDTYIQKGIVCRQRDVPVVRQMIAESVQATQSGQ